MSLEHRNKEDPDQADNGQVLVEHEVTVYIKEEPLCLDGEGSDASPTDLQNHAVKKCVVAPETLEQSDTANSRGIPDVIKVHIKQELIDEEDLTQEILPDAVFQIKVQRIDNTGEGLELKRPVVDQVGTDTSPGVKRVIEASTSPGEKVAVPTEGTRRRKQTRTQFEGPDDSAVTASTERRQITIESGETSTKKRIIRQPGPHLCDVCNKEFKKSNKLLIHKRTHTGERPYTCNICHKQFSYSNGLKVHLRTHTGEKPHVCQTCNKGFGQWSTLKVHERIHTGEKPYSCEICKKEFGQVSHLKKHKLVHIEVKQYSCEKCKKKFKDNTSLKKHERSHTDETLFPCGKRKKNYATIRHLRDHEQAHTRKRRRHSSGSVNALEAKPEVATVRIKQELVDQEDFTQEISPHVVYRIKVGWIDDTVEGLQLEGPVVEQVGPDTSPDGEKVVQPTEGLRRRKQTRTQLEGPGDSAAKASIERRQNTKESGETTTKKRIVRQPGPHLCDVCNKNFKKANKLLIHKRTHTGERPYTCNICHKQFSYSNGLKVHLRTHTGEKPHVCQTCNKGFGQWSTLKDHERRHTGRKCKKNFASVRHLRDHERARRRKRRRHSSGSS